MDKVPYAESLLKRLVLNGEEGLRFTFSRGLSIAHGSAERLRMRDIDPQSDLGLLESKLQRALDAFEFGRAAQAKLAAEAATKEEDMKAAEDDAKVKQEAKAAEKEAATNKAEAEGHIGLLAEQEAAAATALASAQGQDDGTAALLIKGLADPEMQKMHAMLCVSMDEQVILYDRLWEKDDRKPPPFQNTSEGTLWVIPSPSTSRGMPDKIVATLRCGGLGSMGKASDHLHRWGPRNETHMSELLSGVLSHGTVRDR